MISVEAFSLLVAIREKYGPDVKGVGPASLEETCKLAALDEDSTRDVLSELEKFRFVSVTRGIGNVIAGCSIQEAGQSYLDRHLDE